MISGQTECLIDMAMALRQLRRELADFSDEQKWITIGGGPDGKGHRHSGGTPVRIEGNGKIVAGPKSLRGEAVSVNKQPQNTRPVKTFVENGIEFYPVRLKRIDDGGDFHKQYERRFSLLPNGVIEVEAGRGWSERDLRDVSWFHRQLTQQVSGLDPDTFVRVSNNPEDYTYLMRGEHRGSINHRDNTHEGGLSVARDMEIPAKYAYLVKGEQISTGTDGEPLLDHRTAKPVGKLMSGKAMNALLKGKRKAQLQKLGWTDEQFRKAFGNPRLLNSEQFDQKAYG